MHLYSGVRARRGEVVYGEANVEYMFVRMLERWLDLGKREDVVVRYTIEEVE